MGYLHIDNLYKNQDILMFKECYALEKIHGTSAHLQFKNDKISYFSGGENYEKFRALFNEDILLTIFKMTMQVNAETSVIIYGEAYGGKQQGMRNTYGDKLKFIAFDVMIGDRWLNVPDAEKICLGLGLDFVSYNRISTNIEELNKERDCRSIQAFRNGILEPKKREGIVLRPITEVRLNNGKRIIAKHKCKDFRETKTQHIVGEDLKVLDDARKVAEEWVTLMRLLHVLDKMGNVGIEDMKDIIINMIEDIKREGEKEIVWSKKIEKAIGSRTALLFKQYINRSIK